MNKDSLLEERINIFRDAVKQNKVPGRVPYLSNFNTWIEINSPYPLSVALSDYDKTEEIYINFQKKYHFDGYKSVGGFANDLSIVAPLGGEVFRKIDDENNSVQIIDVEVCSHDEIVDFSANPWQFLWSRVMPEKFSNLSGKEAKDRLFQSIRRYQEGQKAAADLDRIFLEKYQVPYNIWSQPVFYSPPDLFQNYIRGIKGLSIDMRKDPQFFKEACDNMAAEFIEKRLAKIENSEPGTNPKVIFDMTISLLAHTIMSYKQFEQFTWPYLKRIIDVAVEKDKLLFLFGEGDIGRFIDFFQEIPPGRAALLSENDDIFELRKKLPNICLAGGMPVSLLGRGTKEECSDYAKKLIDELGRDGGYIFSQDKMVAFANDCKEENLAAVSEVVLTYGINQS